jgi:hypothetical protein
MWPVFLMTFTPFIIAREELEGLLAHKEEQWLLLESGRCTSA